MSLLGDIAAALSEGIGGGMIANAQWGIEEDKQAKKEAADNARLQEQLKRDDARTQAYKDSGAAQLEDNKADRAARAEEARLNRESNERIAAMQRRGAGGGGNISAVFKGLNLIDDKVTGYDKSISDLVKLRSEEMDPAKQAQIDAQIDFFKQQRQNFITSPAVLKVLDSSGEYGQLYKSSLFGEEPAQQGAPQDGGAPESQVVPPPRAVTKPGAEQGLGAGLISKLQEAKANSASEEEYGLFNADPSKTPKWSDVGNNIVHGRAGAEQLNWDSLPKPQGGWQSPVQMKEVQYPNGQKGYTFGLRDQR